LVLDDPTVSRRHARLRRRDGCWSIEDLASTNGTRLNGWRIEDARLRDGDRLALGGAEMVFRER
jgi:pSer/pThr/pTyr-binding forkhead associated (FHA) protein